MRAWPRPHVPAAVGQGHPLRLHDAARQEVVPVPVRDGRASLYVCGVTPYDTTHLGHAATYLTFDLVHRALLNAGAQVVHVQNVTDVDDPLLERAARDGVDWRELAQDQIDLFAEDMTALGVIPPDHYVGVVEAMPQIIEAVTRLLERGVTYALTSEDSDVADIYLDLSCTDGVGGLSHLPVQELRELSAERGGDPQRPGKRDPLDPLLWRGHRAGEPAWDGGRLGSGRPGWHVECTAIALSTVGPDLSIQGGGSDLIFPHHEMSVRQSEALTGRPWSGVTAHQAMVAYDGAKMSKSLGNLVRVSDLRREGRDAMAIRLALLGHHYRSPWEWTAADLEGGEARLARWRAGMSVDGGPDATATIDAVRVAIADDLDTPAAVAAVDRWCDAALSNSRSSGGSSAAAPGELARVCDAVLGVRL